MICLFVVFIVVCTLKVASSSCTTEIEDALFVFVLHKHAINAVVCEVPRTSFPLTLLCQHLALVPCQSVRPQTAEPQHRLWLSWATLGQCCSQVLQAAVPDTWLSMHL